jgi:hypothetical protein
MAKPGGDPSSGISLGDVLRLPKRHLVCRRRETQPGSSTERENLCSDAKGRHSSGAHRSLLRSTPPLCSASGTLILAHTDSIFICATKLSSLVQCCRGEAFGRATRRSEFGSCPRIGLGARARKHLRLRQRSRHLAQLWPILFVLTPIGALVSTPLVSCFGGQFGNSGQHGANGNHSMSACDPLRAPLSEESIDGAI